MFQTVYLAWVYDQYYPTGPYDLKGVFANEDDAYKCIEQYRHLNLDHYKVTTIVVEGMPENDPSDFTWG
jgi:hypothetical protein